MESYVSLVGAIEMGTSIIMVCFLLYLCLGSETRSTAAFVIMGTAVYQTAMFCYLGEQFGTEVDYKLHNLIFFVENIQCFISIGPELSDAVVQLGLA